MATQEQLEQKVTERVRYAVDAEHDSLRLVVAGTFVVTAIIGFVFLSAVIPSGALNLVAIIGGLLIGAGLTSLVERQLKARWPSGREVLLDETSLMVERRGNIAQSIETNGEAQLLRWRFKINKRTRVPKGWYMVALALRDMTNDDHIAIYTLMSPEDFEAFSMESAFTPLQKKDKAVDEGKMRLAGEQRRLHMAETVRWQDGCEMSNSDFQRLAATLEERFSA